MRVPTIIEWFAALVLLVTLNAAFANECKIACKSGGACRITDDSNSEIVVKGRFVVFRFCERLTAKDPLELRYMHGHAWFAPPTRVTGPLKEIFATYPADTPCSIPTSECIQSHMGRMTTAYGGSPLDNRVGVPGGEGQPCAKGFPCGQITIPPNDWRFHLGDGASAGQWIVKLARGSVPPGKAPQTIARIERGTVIADGSWFAPGSKCSYTFIDASGRLAASGEFAIISSAKQENLKELARRQVAAGSPEAIAWTDTLMSNAFEWDAAQESSATGEAP